MAAALVRAQDPPRARRLSASLVSHSSKKRAPPPAVACRVMTPGETHPRGVRHGDPQPGRRRRRGGHRLLRARLRRGGRDAAGGGRHARPRRAADRRRDGHPLRRDAGAWDGRARARLALLRVHHALRGTRARSTRGLSPPARRRSTRCRSTSTATARAPCGTVRAPLGRRHARARRLRGGAERRGHARRDDRRDVRDHPLGR